MRSTADRTLFITAPAQQGGARNLPAYEAQTTFPNPWPGGWWRLRDIVERQKVSAWATLDLAARNKETVRWNAYLKAKRQTERGAAGKPAASVIPAGQHDQLTATTLVAKLLVPGVEIRTADKPFVGSNGVSYSAGAFLVPMAQPKMGLVRYLLGRTFYPDNTYTRNLLQSGWLIGEEFLAKKAAMVSAKLGDGRVVLVGHRTQHRAQTHGTYKLLFNVLLGRN